MIKINKPKNQICNNCGYAYNEYDLREIEIKTDNIEPLYLKPINVKIQLCNNCIKQLKKQLGKELLPFEIEKRKQRKFVSVLIKKI